MFGQSEKSSKNGSEMKLEVPILRMKKIKKVRELIRKKNWCKKVHIIESERNNGLANSIITGVTELVNKFGKIIVLEDDLILSSGFLKFMNYALNMYENEEQVMQIT